MSDRKWARLNWRSKLVLLFSVFSLGPAGVLFFWSMQTLDGQAERDSTERIEGLAKARSQAINQFMEDRVRQVERVATLVVPPMKIVVASKRVAPSAEAPMQELHDAELLGADGTAAPEKAKPTAAGPAQSPEAPATAAPPRPKRAPAVDPKEDATASLRKTLGLILWDQREYEELLIIEPSGVVVASTFQGHEGKTAANIDYFNQGKLSTFVQHVFISPITNKLTMVVATPIKTGDQEVVGVLAARLNLKTFFRLVGDQTGLGQTGETVVAKKIGQRVVFMAPTRHDADAALKIKIELGSKQAMAIQDAARAQVGSGLSTDYRGKVVLAASQHVPVLDWGLVVKMDQDESRAAVISARKQTILLAIAIIVLALICAALVSRALVRPLRELKDATEKISMGELDVKLAIRTRDEIGELADSFERMVAAIKFFREDKTDDDQI